MGERFLTEPTLIRQYLFGGEVPPIPPNPGHQTDKNKGLTLLDVSGSLEVGVPARRLSLVGSGGVPVGSRWGFGGA